MCLAAQLWGRRQSTEAWAIGAKRERAVGARLEKVPGVLVLHDRRNPGSSANIDHITIGPAGIYVIDAKTVSRGRVSVERRGPIWDRGPAKLYVGGRDRSSFADDLGWQVQAVHRAIWGVLRPLASPSARWSWLSVASGTCSPGRRRWAGSGSETAREAAKVVGRPGPFGTEVRQRLAEALMAGLPEA